MIDLGATDFYIDVPSMPRHEFEKYSTKLFDQWEKYVEQALKLPDYSLALEVEEGSIKGGGKIAAALAALYLGVGNYGSFISGIQTIQGQIKSAGNFLAARATVPFDSGKVKLKVKRHEGSLGRLQKLFVKVQQGQMTAEQAMLEAEVLFGSEAEAAPKFMENLKASLEETPLFAQQLELPLSSLSQEVFVQISKEKRLPRPIPPKPELPLGQQFRVEVWRDSKKEKRKVRIIQI